MFESVTAVAVLALMGFGLVGLAAAMLGHAVPVVVLPVGAVVWVGLVMVWRPFRFVVRLAPPATWVLVLGLVVIAAAAVFNLLLHGEYVLTNRDPGIYTNGAAWIAQHGNLVVDSRQDVLDGVAGTQANALGQQSLAGDDTRLEIQGMHLFPVLLAIGSWVSGTTGLFAVPAVVGAIGLCVFFVVALRLLPAWAALTALVALAVNFAWIYTVRSVLSEPLTLTLAFAGLWFTMQAVANRAPREFFIAGLTVAVSLVVRLDAGVAILALLPMAVLLICRAAPTAGRAWGWAGLYGAGWIGPAVLAWIDIHRFSPFYLHFHSDEFGAVLAGTAVAVVLSLATLACRTVYDRSTPGTLPDRVLGCWRRSAPWIGTLAAIAVLALVAYAWWVRPWIEVHVNALGGGGKGTMEALQEQEGLALNGDRTYDEKSMQWLVWYVGPVVVVGAAMAAAVLVRRFLIGRLHADLALLLALVVPISALYLFRPSIYPDQPWAIRRFLPVTIPGFLLLAGWCAAWLLRLSHRLRQPPGRLLTGGLAVVLGAAIVVPPLFVTVPLAGARWEAGGAAGIEALCDALGPDDVALLSREGQISIVFQPAVRGFCPVATAGFVGPAKASGIDATALATRLNAQGRTLSIVANSRQAVLQIAPTAVDVRQVPILSTTEVIPTLSRAPSASRPLKYSVWVGRVPPA